MKQVLVFKTSVNSAQEMHVVEPLLNKLVNKTGRWNFDLEDCDKILRVESEFIGAEFIIEKLACAGIMCSELE